MNHERIALIYDKLDVYAGGERVLEQMIGLYPQADVCVSVDIMKAADRGFLRGKVPITTFAQNLPFVNHHQRHFLLLLMFAIEQLDMSDYDLVLSGSASIAKGVITGPDQLHISYVHSPMRYAWDLQHQYLGEAKLDKGLRSFLARYMLHRARGWDLRTSNGVDHFIANSQFIARRIWKVYRREATVIYPPVDVDNFALRTNKEPFYLTASRMVPYKKIAAIVEAFRALPDRKLVVVGDGPEMKRIKALAGPNVEILGLPAGERAVRPHAAREVLHLRGRGRFRHHAGRSAGLRHAGAGVRPRRRARDHPRSRSRQTHRYVLRPPGRGDDRRRRAAFRTPRRPHRAARLLAERAAFLRAGLPRDLRPFRRALLGSVPRRCRPWPRASIAQLALQEATHGLPGVAA